MAIAGPNYECLYADVGTNGRANDAGIWDKCSFKETIYEGNCTFPAPDNLLETCDKKEPYVFLADDAFGMKSYLLKSFSGREIDFTKRIFNYRLSRARRIGENLLGIDGECICRP